MAGIAPTTFATYVSMGTAPKPDGYTQKGKRRYPWWEAETVQDWQDHRPLVHYFAMGKDPAHRHNARECPDRKATQ